MNEVERLSHFTKALVFLVTVAATEMGSNVGLYFAIAVWLELDVIIKIEKSILEYFRRGK